MLENPAGFSQNLSFQARKRRSIGSARARAAENFESNMGHCLSEGQEMHCMTCQSSFAAAKRASGVLSLVKTWEGFLQNVDRRWFSGRQ